MHVIQAINAFDAEPHPDSQKDVLVIVHPGSACGSADFNYGGGDVAEPHRRELIREWRGWGGGVIVIDGSLSDELSRYPNLYEALEDVFERARDLGLIAERIPGEDPEHGRALTSALQRWQIPCGGVRFLVTGAWHYDGDEGCVGSIHRCLKALGYVSRISPAALRDG